MASSKHQAVTDAAPDTPAEGAPPPPPPRRALPALARGKPAELQAQLAALPEAPGVYLFLDAAGVEIYVGKANSLRARVRSYFQAAGAGAVEPKQRQLVAEAAGLAYIETASEVEALLLESRLIKDLQPKYNVRLRSDAGYPYLEVTWGEDFPQVRVTRRRGRTGSQYYGPFVNAGELRRAVQILRRVFRFRGCRQPLDAEGARARRVRPCLNFSLGLCAGCCAGRITREAYREQIRRFTAFIQGQHGELLRELDARMRRAARELCFEEAADCRDQLEALRSLDQRGSLSDAIEPEVPTLDPREGLARLGEVLGLSRAPETLEGLDIATLGGGESVGAVVTFARGLPTKDGYRRFRIKSVAGQDDYAMLREVVERRYGRLLAEGRPLPDLVLVDGGLGQLRAAAEGLRAVGLTARAAKIEPAARGRRREATSGDPSAERSSPPAGARVSSEGRQPLVLDQSRDQAPAGAAEECGADILVGHPEWQAGMPAPPSGAPGGAQNTKLPEASGAPTAGPVLLALAKRAETLYTLGTPGGARLPRQSPALRVLQYARDEAHRFAQHYHHILRRKRVLEEDRPRRARNKKTTKTPRAPRGKREKPD